MATRRVDPYAILDDRQARSGSRALVAWLVPLVVVALFLGLLAYVVSEVRDDEVPPPPGVNTPHQP